jgi:hypothetical protein
MMLFSLQLTVGFDVGCCLQNRRLDVPFTPATYVDKLSIYFVYVLSLGHVITISFERLRMSHLRILMWIFRKNEEKKKVIKIVAEYKRSKFVVMVSNCSSLTKK